LLIRGQECLDENRIENNNRQQSLYIRIQKEKLFLNKSKKVKKKTA